MKQFFNDSISQCKWRRLVKIVAALVVAKFALVCLIRSIEMKQQRQQCDLNGHPADRMMCRFRKKHPKTGANGPCELPNVDPWNSEVAPYIFNVGPLNCSEHQPELLKFDTSTGILSKQFHNDKYECAIQCFEKKIGDERTVKFDGTWRLVTNESNSIPCEFFKARCLDRMKKSIVYQNTFLQIIPKPPKLRIDKRSAVTNHKSNILYFIIDGVSRNNFIRQLPKSLKVIEELWGATVLRKHLKTGRNSWPNSISLYTGRERNRDSDLIDGYAADDYFDNWPLIWKDFDAAGYRTLYAEDCVRFSLFTYPDNKGFRHAPATHYPRPFWTEICSEEDAVRKASSMYCYGKRREHNILFDYVLQFFSRYPASERLAAFPWLIEITHGYLNDASMMDQDFAQFLAKLHAAVGSRTWLVIVSDHGISNGDYRQTYNGFLEYTLPFAAIAAPPAFDDARRNLKINSQILTSHYDLYVTAQDVLRSATSNNWNFESADPELKNVAWRGESLLRPMNVNRQCDDVGVIEEHCLCGQSNQPTESLDVATELVKSAARWLLNFINEMISAKFSSECAVLTLNNVVRAVWLNEPTSTSRGLLLVALIANPSNASIEGYFATGSLDLGTPLSRNMTRLFGTPARTNKYGNQSYCINDVDVRPFCYCKSLVQ